MQLLQARLGFGDDRIVALGLAEPDQLDRVIDLTLDAAIALDRPLEAGALAQDLLRLGRVIPELGIFRLGVQLGEAPVGNLPVKDASLAASTTSGCRRPPPVSRRAFVRILCPNRHGRTRPGHPRNQNGGPRNKPADLRLNTLPQHARM
jgi:hypothetical protein